LDEMVTFSLFIITPDEAKKAKEVVKTGAFLHSPNKSDFLMEKLGMTARGNAFLKLIPNSVPFEQNAPKHEFARAITGLYNRLRISSDELDRMIEFLPSIQTHEDAEVAKKIFETREFLTSPDKHNFLAKKFEEMATQST